MGKNQVEFIYRDDVRVKAQTVAHHLERYNFVARKFPGKESKKSLDLACGTGYGTDVLRKAGYKSDGVDISEKAIRYARQKYPECKFYLDSVQNYKFGDYDLVVFFESLEHINDKDSLVLFPKIKKSLNKGGIFVVSVSRDPNPKHDKWHQSRWNYTKLRETLEKYFDTVEILGQDWDTSKISLDRVVENDFYIAVCNNT